MTTVIWYLFIIALLAVVAAAAYFVVKSYMNGTSPRAALFGPRPPPRLAVMDHANVDGRRRLILIRRDDTEHLIMTGGPVDVVIETNITPPEQPAPAATAKPREEVAQRVSMPVFTRTPRAASGGGESAAE
jgi:flagellar protein FliO/FliZ